MSVLVSLIFTFCYFESNLNLAEIEFHSIVTYVKEFSLISIHLLTVQLIDPCLVLTKSICQLLLILYPKINSSNLSRSLDCGQSISAVNCKVVRGESCKRRGCEGMREVYYTV